MGVVNKVNSIFNISLPLDPSACLLGKPEEYEWEAHTREAIHRVLFQARKLIMVHWKSEDPPTIGEWVKNIGEVLRTEKLIYQHRESTLKYICTVVGCTGACPGGSDHG